MAKDDGEVEGLEVNIKEKINGNKNLDKCKVPPTLEVVKNSAAEIIPTSDNAGSESGNYCATDIEDTEDEIKYKYSPLGM